MRKELLIIIPVLNEKKNIKPLVKNINKFIKYKNKHLLFIDDNSTDGTKEEINEIKSNKIFLIEREKKLGIGSAHKVGLNWGYKKKYKYIITMDSDGTHNPKYINSMIKNLEKKKCLIVSTNRFLVKKSLKSWTPWRRFLTTVRHYLVQFLLGIEFDSSGAFRGYNVKNTKLSNILSAKSNSYSFFWESIFILSLKYKIKEIPISLPARKAGVSKMRIKDIISAILYLFYFSFIKRFFIKVK